MTHARSFVQTLRPDSSPRFDTVSRVCAALGVRLVAQTIHSTQMQLVPNKRLRDVLYAFQDGPKVWRIRYPWESWVELGEDFLRRQRLR